MIRRAPAYGATDNIEDWLEIAQFVNYEGYRGMYEADTRGEKAKIVGRRLQHYRLV